MSVTAASKPAAVTPDPISARGYQPRSPACALEW